LKIGDGEDSFFPDADPEQCKHLFVSRDLHGTVSGSLFEECDRDTDKYVFTPASVTTR